MVGTTRTAMALLSAPTSGRPLLFRNNSSNTASTTRRVAAAACRRPLGEGLHGSEAGDQRVMVQMPQNGLFLTHRRHNGRGLAALRLIIITPRLVHHGAEAEGEGVAVSELPTTTARRRRRWEVLGRMSPEGAPHLTDPLRHQQQRWRGRGRGEEGAASAPRRRSICTKSLYRSQSTIHLFTMSC